MTLPQTDQAASKAPKRVAVRYSQNTAKALLRERLETTGIKGNNLVAALATIRELLAELHHASGRLQIDAATYAFTNGYPNTDEFLGHLSLAVKLGLLTKERKTVANGTGNATVGVILTLTANGQALIQAVSSEHGRQAGAALIQASRKRMLRKSRKTSPTNTRVTCMPDVCAALPLSNRSGAVKTPEDTVCLTPHPPGRTDLTHHNGQSSPTTMDEAHPPICGLIRDQEKSRGNQEEIEELSPQASCGPVHRGQEKAFLQSASQVAIRQQQRLGCAGHGGIDGDSFRVWLDTIAKHNLSTAEVEQRICNLFAWLASQHWVNQRPYPDQVAAAITHHLAGGYPCEPDADGDQPDCHAETLCTCTYDAQQAVFRLYGYDDTLLGVVGYWDGASCSDYAPCPPEAPAALNKELTPDSCPVNAVEAVLGTPNPCDDVEAVTAPVQPTQNVFLVNAAVSASPEPSAPSPLASLLNTPPETQASQPKRAAANDIAGQIAQLKALGIEITRPSSYAHIPDDDDGGVGENAQLWQRRTLVAATYDNTDPDW